jgi:DNA modification methylase
MRWKLIKGDCIAGMDGLADSTVHCCVTSPPYFGLRDYGCEGQIGLEQSPDEYVSRLVDVFRSVRRILRDDGTLWLNLGDSWASTPQGTFNAPQKMAGKNAGVYGNFRRKVGLPPKNLIGIPWRVAFALQADGWFLRQDIIWHKPNPMPESVRDRCTEAHEYIFLLSKKQNYYYDCDAVKEPVAESTIERLQQKNLMNQVGSSRVPGKTNGNMKAVGNTQTRNRRSVWTIPTRGFKGAHFAVYPEQLIEPCILAGCPLDGTVFDPFTGSGTTAVVALRNQRNFIGTELNPEYCEIARNRIGSDMPLYATQNAIQ